MEIIRGEIADLLRLIAVPKRLDWLFWSILAPPADRNWQNIFQLNRIQWNIKLIRTNSSFYDHKHLDLRLHNIMRVLMSNV